MIGLALVLLAAALLLRAIAAFIGKLELIDRIQADIGTDDGWYEDVDSRLEQRQQWDRPNLRSVQ